MAEPIQQFIQNYMGFQGFLEQQRQFNQQEALQQRAQDAQEINNFAVMLTKASNPLERQSLAQAFAQKNPELAPLYENLGRAVTPEMSTILAGAAGELSPEKLTQGVEVSLGTGLSAGQQQQGQQFEKQFGEGQRQFNVNFGEDVRQFGVRSALQQHGLRLQERGVNIDAARLSQQGELGMMGLYAQAGVLPMNMQSDLSVHARELQDQLASTENPEERDKIALEISDTRAMIEQLGRVQEAQTTRGGGPALGVGDLPGLIDTRSKIIEKLGRSKNEADKQGLEENYAQLTALINSIAPTAGATPLDNRDSAIGQFIGSILDWRP